MSLDPHPIARFQELFKRAAASAPFDHTAMTLATCDEAGRPAARVVLLHGLDDRGFVFYTNYESRKGLEIEANPWAALVFYWPWLDQQVRIEGTVVRLSDEESDAYFASRPRGKQVGAWASRAESSPRISRGARAALRRRGGALRREERAAAAVLGRLSARTRPHGVLEAAASIACTIVSATSARAMRGRWSGCIRRGSGAISI